jgi:hypothetical protein
MRAEATEADHAARAVALAAYAHNLALSNLNRELWEDVVLAEVEYAESRMAEGVTERRELD